MAKYGNRYGFHEPQNTREFHKSRRMFCIKDNKLYIARTNLPYSHAIWFEKEGWTTPDDDSAMSKLTRGFIDTSGNIHFFVGYNFSITDDAFEDMKNHLRELVHLLNLDKNGQIYGGRIRNEIGGFVPLKSYGKISDILS
jgi:hypothetical protein